MLIVSTCLSAITMITCLAATPSILIYAKLRHSLHCTVVLDAGLILLALFLISEPRALE